MRLTTTIAVLMRPILQVMVVVAVVHSSMASAQEDQSKPLVVGFLQVSPYFVVGPDGHKTGFFIDLARAIGEEIGVEIVVKEMPDQAAFLRAQAEGETQMIAGASVTGLFETTGVFSTPVATETLQLAVLTAKADQMRGPIAGYRIGNVPPVVADQAAKLASDNEMVAFENSRAALMDLLSGRIDGVLFPNPGLVNVSRDAQIDDRIAFVGPLLDQVQRVVVLDRSRADLLPAVNAAIARMEADGRLEDLRRRYFLQTPPAAPEVLTVGVTHAPPYMIVEAGSVSGFAISAFEDLAGRAGLDFAYQVLPPEAYLSSVRRGDVDLIPFVLALPEFQRDADVTQPLRAYSVAAYAPGGTTIDSAEDLPGGHLGMRSNLSPIVARDGMDATDIKTFADSEATVAALISGEIDAVIDDLDAVLAETDAPIAAAFDLQGTMALRFGLGAERVRLNAVVPAYVLSDRYQELQAQYFGALRFWTGERLRLLGLVVGLTVLSLLAVIFWQEQRRRRSQFIQQGRDLARERTHSDSLRELVASLETANRQQQELTYAISHDLKSPTNTMGMLIDELQQLGAVGEGGHDVLADMSATNKRMASLIADVLDYAEVVDNDQTFQPLALNDVYADVVSDLASEIAQTGATITRDALPVIIGLPNQLRVLLQNLLSNAIKFHDDTAKPVIHVGARSEEGAFFLTITDNGIGIADKQAEKIFGLFSRLHGRSRFTGSGIGLGICRRVMTNHGGTISVRPNQDRGSVFELMFPERQTRDQTHQTGLPDRRRTDRSEDVSTRHDAIGSR